MGTFNTTIEVDIVVHYDDVPACRGSRDSYGVPQEPDEPAHIEITHVETAKDGIALSDSEKQRICEEIAEHLDDAEDFSRSEHADAMRDARRDNE